MKIFKKTGHVELIKKYKEYGKEGFMFWLFSSLKSIGIDEDTRKAAIKEACDIVGFY